MGRDRGFKNGRLPCGKCRSRALVSVRRRVCKNGRYKSGRCRHRPLQGCANGRYKSGRSKGKCRSRALKPKRKCKYSRDKRDVCRSRPLLKNSKEKFDKFIKNYCDNEEDIYTLEPWEISQNVMSIIKPNGNKFCADRVMT